MIDLKTSVLKWASILPDLNIIENVWEWLAIRLYSDGCQYQNTVQLDNARETAWNVIPRKYLT